VVAIPLEASTDVEITLLANLVTLTPGSLSIDVSPDRGCLFVHAMFVENPDQLRSDIKQGFERRVVELLR
jgi:multicomponent Na+:H+ antiporter subunit E